MVCPGDLRRPSRACRHTLLLPYLQCTSQVREIYRVLCGAQNHLNSMHTSVSSNQCMLWPCRTFRSAMNEVYEIKCDGHFVPKLGQRLRRRVSSRKHFAVYFTPHQLERVAPYVAAFHQCTSCRSGADDLPNCCSSICYVLDSY
jgi:hypothetical protein